MEKIDKKRIFAIMPFCESWSDDIYNIIKSATEGYDIKRADEIYGIKKIIDEIANEIITSDIIISVLTGGNRNVNYELGMAHAWKKPTIMIAKTIDDIPFDYQYLRVILYDTNNPNWGEILKNKINLTITEIIKESNFSVEYFNKEIYKKSKMFWFDFDDIEFLNGINEPKYIEDYAEHIKLFSKLGIKKMHYPCIDMNIPDEVISNAKSIKILFTAGPTFFSVKTPKLKLALDNNAEIKVILATKESVYVKETMETEQANPHHYNDHDINTEIKNAFNNLKSCRTSSNNGKIFLSYFNTQFRANVVIIDNEITFYTPLLPPKQSRQTLTFELHSGKIFEDCEVHFDTLYDILEKDGKIEEI